MYIPLHVHYTKGSVGDSVLKTKEAVEKAKKLGMTSLAITDHGSMANVIEFYKECTEQGIKPIIGMEAYEAYDRTITEKESFHLVLLAKNKDGYKDLLHIGNDAQMNGFYYKPRTDVSVLKEYGKNIIALSGCVGGKIPQLILKANQAESKEEIQLIYNKIVSNIEEYKSIFADFYLELQPGEFEEQKIVNNLLIELAKETNTKLIVTNDVHYLDSDDYIMHDQHVKINRKMKESDNMVYPDKCYYLMGHEELITKFFDIDMNILSEAIENTVKVAYSINLDGLYDGKIKMPKADIPEGFTEDSYLEYLAYRKLDDIQYDLKDPSEYYDRAEYELETLREVGFSGYLLIIKDIYDYANRNSIKMGPGRGSISGSLIAFLIGITKVDPIKYDLLFERFISIHRKGSIPDVDLDVESNRRLDLFNYTIEKYGEECCALVSTFGTRKARSAIKDIARIYDIDCDTANYVAKLIPLVYYNDEDGEKQVDLSIQESLEVVSELREYQKQYPEWFEAAMKLEDSIKTTSIHAAGTLISPTPLGEYVPLVRGDNMMATALNLTDAEYSGAIKYDYLSLATLDVVSATERDIGIEYDCNDDEWFKDDSVWDLIGSKDVTTLFQISSDTYKKRMHRLKPRTIEELAACLALVRGPCISSKLDEVYMQVVEGTREIDLIHPFYDSVTNKTNGVLLYQEQMMQILVNFGMDLERAFQVMKYAAKKKEKLLAKAEGEFRELARKNNVPEDSTTRIWSIMLDTGRYSFNKSHAISYAILCYYTAYLKVHYTKYWMKNALTNAYGRKENIPTVVQECRRLGIRFLGLDINKSKWEFSIEDDSIRIGFVAAKGLGNVAYEQLALHRPYNSLSELIEKAASNKFNKKAFIVSIFGGGLESLGQTRLETYKEYMLHRKEEIIKEIKISKDMVFYCDADNQVIESVIYETPIISNPVQNFDHIDFDSIRDKEIFCLDAVVRKVKKIKDKNGNPMAFLTLETSFGYIDCTIFSSAYKGNTKYMKNNCVIKIKARKDKDSLVLQEFL